MVAEEQSSPMPEHDPSLREEGDDDTGGQPSEFLESDRNEPGSQAPPSGEAAGDDED